MCDYRFSPSTIDKFSRLLEAEQEFESDFNYNEESGYKKSLEEIVAEREQELLDAINHVPFVSEAAARGTAFNNLVDLRIEEINGDVFNEDATIETEVDGFKFIFDNALVTQVAMRLLDSTMQMHIAAELETERGSVLLHGFPDYILPTQVTDLKTTESYTFGKYEHYWQRFTYPYILLKQGLMQRIDAFEFLVVEVKKDRKTGIISGTIYTEPYTGVNVNLAKCETELKWICEGLILWLEDHRDQITNRKIFNEHD